MSTNTHFIDHVVSGLRVAAEELEEFQLQLGLGKLEAREIYENLKKDYRLSSHALLIKIDQGKQMTTDLRTSYDQFLLQLALGRADTMEQFKEQRAKILLAIHEFKVAISTHTQLGEIYNELVLLLEKLEIKLEMLSNNWQPTADKLKKEFTERKVQIENLLSDLKSKLAEYSNVDVHLDVFNKEMSEAYSHFKKAFAG